MCEHRQKDRDWLEGDRKLEGGRALGRYAITGYSINCKLCISSGVSQGTRRAVTLLEYCLVEKGGHQLVQSECAGNRDSQG